MVYARQNYLYDCCNAKYKVKELCRNKKKQNKQRKEANIFASFFIFLT